MLCAQKNAPAAQANPATRETAWLAQARQLYYSMAKNGVTGFDCAIHPDWRTLLASTQPETALAETKPADVEPLLATAKITLYARLKGSSTVEWEPGDAPAGAGNQKTADAVEELHQLVESGLQGFLQFWTPLISGEAVPEGNEPGLKLASTESGHTARIADGDTDVMEQYSRGLVLERYEARVEGTPVTVVPQFAKTKYGLVLSELSVRIQQGGKNRDSTFQAKIEYREQAGAMLPSQVEMELRGTVDEDMEAKRNVSFHFTLDGCKTVH
jgi:hypothetical protein